MVSVWGKLFAQHNICRERGDKNLMEELFNSLEEIVQRSESKREREGSPNADQQWSADRPVDRVHNVHKRSSVDRPIDCSKESGRPERSTDWHTWTFCWQRSTDRSTEGRDRSTDRRTASPDRIQTSFLKRGQIQL